MQGLNEMGGGNAPATSHQNGCKRYMPTLAAFMVPAILSGMVAAFVYADAKPRNVPELDLVTRTQMVRYAAQKVPTDAEQGVALAARATAEHQPLDDVSVAAASDVDIAVR